MKPDLSKLRPGDKVTIQLTIANRTPGHSNEIIVEEFNYGIIKRGDVIDYIPASLSAGDTVVGAPNLNDTRGQGVIQHRNGDVAWVIWEDERNGLENIRNLVRVVREVKPKEREL